MSDTTRSTPACDLSGIREAVCVHTDKITDSCLAKDCIEDLHVYLTVESQCTLDKAVSAKARFVELMHVAIQLDPVPYSAGYYTVDITYYYRVIADARHAGRTPPAPSRGLPSSPSVWSFSAARRRRESIPAAATKTACAKRDCRRQAPRKQSSRLSTR